MKTIKYQLKCHKCPNKIKTTVFLGDLEVLCRKDGC